MTKHCINCGEESRNKFSSLCESCFRESLHEKAAEAGKIIIEHPSNKYF